MLSWFQSLMIDAGSATILPWSGTNNFSTVGRDKTREQGINRKVNLQSWNGQSLQTEQGLVLWASRDQGLQTRGSPPDPWGGGGRCIGRVLCFCTWLLGGPLVQSAGKGTKHNVRRPAAGPRLLPHKSHEGTFRLSPVDRGGTGEGSEPFQY